MNVKASIKTLSAVTLATTDMVRSVEFYVSLGFTVHYGGAKSTFTTLHSGASCINLVLRNSPSEEKNRGGKNWGRMIFFVNDVDTFYRQVVTMGLRPESAPADADWGERYFHLRDPDGHSLSFAVEIEHSCHAIVPSFDEVDALETEIASARMEAGE
jgi:catechol 2,3-dioxygenase-like lactoylglutathione lyase family enzyme